MYAQRNRPRGTSLLLKEGPKVEGKALFAEPSVVEKSWHMNAGLFRKKGGTREKMRDSGRQQRTWEEEKIRAFLDPRGRMFEKKAFFS